MWIISAVDPVTGNGSPALVVTLCGAIATLAAFLGKWLRDTVKFLQDSNLAKDKQIESLTAQLIQMTATTTEAATKGFTALEQSGRALEKVETVLRKRGARE